MTRLLWGSKRRSYCARVSQSDWPARIAKVIAGEVKRYRHERGLSAQQLAERCAALGAEFPRAVLANLETGRRETVSVAEVLVLAQALDISPMLLIVPLGRHATAEILPDVEMQAWDATRWIGGTAKLSNQPGQGLQVGAADDDSVIVQFHYHDQLVEDWRESAGEGWEDGGTGQIVKMRSLIARSLRELRSRMRKSGLIPPPLPPDLAHLDDGWSDGR